MHELSLASAVVDAALRHAGGGRVVAVHLRIGALRQASPEALAFAFELVAEGTACAGARLALERVPAVLACARCSAECEVREPPLACRTCGATDVRVVAGEELELESLEVEEETACTGRS